MTDEREVLSALIDGEPVDAEVLTRLLEEPANRRMLADFARLRAIAREPVSAEGASPSVATRRVWPAGWAGAAAVLLMLGAAAGAGAWAERFVSRERPPEPVRIVQFEPVFAP